MTNLHRFVASKLIVVLAAMVLISCCLTHNAFAQDYSRIVNRLTQTQIHIEYGTPVAGAADPTWWSADWVIEPVAGEPYVRFKNRWKGTYLNVEKGPLAIGTIEPSWWSAQWTLEQVDQNSVRIKNRWTGVYLHVEGGHLKAGAIEPDWRGAQWEITGRDVSPTEPNLTVSGVWVVTSLLLQNTCAGEIPDTVITNVTITQNGVQHTPGLEELELEGDWGATIRMNAPSEGVTDIGTMDTKTGNFRITASGSLEEASFVFAISGRFSSNSQFTSQSLSTVTFGADSCLVWTSENGNRQ